MHVKLSSEIIIKLYQSLKEFWSYFKIISATLNMLENIHELRDYFRKFPRAKMKLLQTDVDKG